MLREARQANPCCLTGPACAETLIEAEEVGTRERAKGNAGGVRDGVLPVKGTTDLLFLASEEYTGGQARKVAKALPQASQPLRPVSTLRACPLRLLLLAIKEKLGVKSLKSRSKKCACALDCSPGRTRAQLGTKPGSCA